jgi:hypothetical protein
LLDSDEVEERLRDYFLGATANLEPDERLVARVIKVGRRKRRRRVALVAAAVSAVATASAVLAGGGGPAHEGGGVTLRLADYAFPLPSGYRLSASTVLPSCFPVAISRAPVNPTGDPTVVPPMLTPYTSSGLSSAITANGGCLTMWLTPPYMFASSGSDPYELLGSTVVTVGGHQGWLDDASNGLNPGNVDLGVRIPLGGGQYQDLLVGTSQVSTEAILAIVTHGLPA